MEEKINITETAEGERNNKINKIVEEIWEFSDDFEDVIINALKDHVSRWDDEHINEFFNSL